LTFFCDKNNNRLLKFILLLLASMPAIAQDLNFQDTTFRDSFEEAAIWISEVDGNWSDGFNWESGSPPAEGQAVIIKVPTDVVVTIDTGPLVVSSIVSEESLLLNTTLTVNGPILNNGGLTMAGTLINAYVLPGSTHDVGMTGGGIIRNVRMGKTISSGIRNNSLTVEDGLTLDGAIVVWGGSGSSFSTASFNGNTPYTINGTGEILIGNGANGISGNADITLGPDITLRGYVGNFSPGSILINQGTVHSDLPGTLTFGKAGMSVINDGVMKGTGGGSLSLAGNWTNNTAITIQDGGTLNLNGTYDNQGTIVATDSIVNLGGEFTIAGLGELSRTGGSVVINGILNNAPGLVLDSTTGTWVINGGQIVGGTLETLDGATLSAQNRHSVLDGVTINGNLNIGANSSINIINSLALNDQIVINGSTGSLFASLSINGDSPIMIDGTGEIVFGGGDNFLNGTADVTIGTDITLSGWHGDIQPGSVLTNLGTVHSSSPGMLTIGKSGMTVTNDGVIKGTGGGSLSLAGNWTNNTSITIQDSGTLNLNGTYDNQGTIVATDSIVNLGGEFTIEDLGNFSRTGGSVVLQGTLNNAPGLVLDSTTGGWVINNGKIIGGVIETLDGASLSAQNRNSVLDGVTINGNLNIGTSSSINIINSLALNGQVVINGSTGSLFASLSINGDSPIMIGGTGEIVFGGGDNNLNGTADVTIGPGIILHGLRGNISPGSVLTNQGTVHSSSSGTLTIGKSGMTVINEGVVKGSGSGNIAVWGLASNDGTFQIAPGSMIQTEQGGYTQSASGALIIDISGLGTANHGQLTATEGVSLAGSLTVNLVDAYVPEIGDTFTIVTGTSISGTFDTVNGLVIDGGKQFNVNYNATDVTLEVVSVP